MHVHRYLCFNAFHSSYVDINECLIPNFDGCVHAQCNNTMGSYMCICEPGFISDGENNCIGNVLASYNSAHQYFSDCILICNRCQ